MDTIGRAARAQQKLRGRGFTAPDAEGVGDAVDVVEPRGDERDLQDAAVVEAGPAQTLVVRGAR